jgi:hypothetical protein
VADIVAPSTSAVVVSTPAFLSLCQLFARSSSLTYIGAVVGVESVWAETTSTATKAENRAVWVFIFFFAYVLVEVPEKIHNLYKYHSRRLGRCRGL